MDSYGTNLGILDTDSALKISQNQGLDLVEINPKSSPPVCKIMDYGKYKYEENKKLKDSKKNQHTQELKEITFGPYIEENDLNHKLEQTKDFLKDSAKVKFTIRFRGREIIHPNIGREKLEWLLQKLIGSIEPNPSISIEGKFMRMTITPSKL